MLRGLIGYILGAFCALVTFVCCLPSDEYTGSIIFAITFDIIILTSFLTWCHKHHIRKRNEYYDKVRCKRTY